MTYITLFIVAFISATLLPLGSEALLIYNISKYETFLLFWIVATMGNSLGSILNYYLGSKGEGYLNKKGYLSKAKIEKYKTFFDKYGAWSLCLSWAPIIGDPLTFVAGMLHYNIKYFIVIISIAKGLRYAVVIFLASNLSV